MAPDPASTQDTAAPGYARLTTAPATPAQRTAALVFVGLLLLILAVSIPFMSRSGPVGVPFLPVVITLICFANLATCYLLIMQFRVHRAPALMTLAATYTFASLIAVAFLVTFPGVFSPTGLFGAQSATAAWLWVFWHVGFPLGVLLALLMEHYHPLAVMRRTAVILFVAFLGVVVALVSLLSLVALHMTGWLPTIIAATNYHAIFTSGVGVVIWAVNALTLWALFVLGRGHGRGVVWMWIAVNVFASLCSMTITLLGTNRYSIGWYIGWLDDVLAACVVLGALLSAANGLYYHLAVQEHELRTLFDLSPIGMARIALDDRILETNAALRAMLGYTDTELRAITLYGLIAPDNALREIHDPLGASARKRESDAIEAPLTRRDGSVFWAEVRLTVVRGRNGIAPYCIVLVEDINMRIAHEREIVHDAAHDALTDLPNRRQVMEHFAHAARRSTLTERRVAVLFLDLDGFKGINDTYGHGAGDAILREVARRLEMSIRTGDVAGRLGGDEFVLVLSGILQREDTGIVVDRVLDALAVPFVWENTVIAVGASIGISIFPDDSNDITALLSKADVAMYEQKIERRAVGNR